MTTSNITTFAGTTNAEVLKIFNYDVCLPIFALGVLLNGAVTLTAAVARKRLITNRLDGFLVLLTFVVLLWCLLSTIRPLVELTSTATFPTNVIKLYTSFFLLLIFGINTLIAMERYFTIVQQKEEECQKNYWAAIFTWCLLASTVVFDYMLGANQKHDEMLYTWFETISPPAMVAILFTMTFITGGIYVGTYLVSKRKIRASLANKRSSKFDVDVIRVKLERKILFSCIAMGGSIFVCYMPISIVMLGALYEPAGDFTAALVFGNLMVALDVLISPALVLVFMPALRKTLFGVFKRQTAASQEGDGRV